MPEESIDDVLDDVLFDGKPVPAARPRPPAEPSITVKAKSVRLVTASTFVREGFEVVDTLPVVRARRAYGTGGWKDLKIGMRDALGGRSKTTEDIVEKIERELSVEIQIRAAERGASVVCGFRLHISMFEGTMFLGRAYGTPLVVHETGV